MMDPTRSADDTPAKPSAGALLLVGCAGVLFSVVTVFVGVCSIMDHAVFSISRDGKVLGAWVKTSSGQAVLDRAAIETIRRAQPLPAIPPALPDPFKIELALGFDAP